MPSRIVSELDDNNLGDRRTLIQGIFRRSAYYALGLQMPKCFEQFQLDVEEELLARNASAGAILKEPSLILGANLIRRLGDLEFYRASVGDSLSLLSKSDASIIVGSLLVGYFSTAKSVLDAISIALDNTLQLGLANRQQDLSKNEFWTELQKKDQAFFKAFAAFKPFVSDVVAWRDAAVHRITPLVMIQYYMQEEARNRPPVIKMAAQPNVDFSSFTRGSVAWIDPLEIPNAWEKKFEQISEQVCRKIVYELKHRST